MSIVERNGRFTAQIRIKKAGKLIFSEARTFAKLRDAEKWKARREQEVRDKPEMLRKLRHQGVTLGQLIERYTDDLEKTRKFGRTKSTALDQLARQPLAAKDALGLERQDIIGHVIERRKIVSQQTALNDLVWLRIVFRYARIGCGIPVDTEMLAEAASYCRDEKLVGKSRRRTRRPTADELLRITAWFTRPTRRSAVPMALLMWFAIYSGRRLSEQCELLLSDYDPEHRTWWVRTVKHPDGSDGNDKESLILPRLVPLIDHAIETIPREPGEDRLFPFESHTVGNYWTAAMKILGIKNLHWHDLRHEACSRLAEDGLTVPEMQQVSLHESWSSLQIYVNMRAKRADRIEWSPCNTIQT